MEICCKCCRIASLLKQGEMKASVVPVAGQTVPKRCAYSNCCWVDGYLSLLRAWRWYFADQYELHFETRYLSQSVIDGSGCRRSLTPRKFLKVSMTSTSYFGYLERLERQLNSIIWVFYRCDWGETKFRTRLIYSSVYLGLWAFRRRLVWLYHSNSAQMPGIDLLQSLKGSFDSAQRVGNTDQLINLNSGW